MFVNLKKCPWFKETFANSKNVHEFENKCSRFKKMFMIQKQNFTNSKNVHKFGKNVQYFENLVYNLKFSLFGKNVH